MNFKLMILMFYSFTKRTLFVSKSDSFENIFKKL